MQTGGLNSYYTTAVNGAVPTAACPNLKSFATVSLLICNGDGPREAGLLVEGRRSQGQPLPCSTGLRSGAADAATVLCPSALHAQTRQASWLRRPAGSALLAGHQPSTTDKLHGSYRVQDDECRKLKEVGAVSCACAI